MKSKLFFAAAAAAMLLPLCAFAEDTGGTYGDNISWSCSGGVLTLSGSGPTKDNDSYPEDLPWKDYKDEITEVRFEEGITSVGKQLCRDMKNLTRVSLPSTLDSIGIFAFDSCYKLADAELPQGLTELGERAFQDTAVSRVDIPGSVAYVGAGAYKSCPRLTSVVVNEGTTAISDEAFAECGALVDLKLPSTLEKIGFDVFKEDNAIRNADIPEGLSDKIYDRFKHTEWWKELENESGGCVVYKNMLIKYVGTETDVKVPAGVNYIAERAFEQAEVKTVALPDGVAEIGESAFAKSELTKIKLPQTLNKIGLNAFELTPIEEISIPEGVETLPYHAFYNCYQLNRVELPQSLQRIEASCFEHCQKLSSAKLPEGLLALGHCAFSDTALTEAIIPDTCTEIDDSVFSDCKSLKRAKLPKGLSAVPNGIFTNTAIESIELDSNIKEIGWSAFQGCKGLNSITLPQGLEVIGIEAFRDCTGIREINLSGSLKEIGYNAFGGTGIKELVIPGGITDIMENHVFMCCKELEKVTIEKGNTILSTGTFSECEKLREVILPEGLENIGPLAFEKCVSLSEIHIPNTVTKIEGSAFRDCSGLKEIIIPDSVRMIYPGVFRGCESLEKVTLPNGIDNIGNYTFEDCKSLREIELPESVTEIGEYVFSGCTSLERVKLPSGLKGLKVGVFSLCRSLEEIYIPESVGFIKNDAFAECGRVTLHIPPSVTKISDAAFDKSNPIIYARPESKAYGLAVKMAYELHEDYMPGVGDIVDSIIPSDISVILNERVIPSYCVNGRTILLLRDLESYGFDVSYDEESRTAYADYNPDKSVAGDTAKTELADPYILYTDIRAVVNGAELEARNTNGYIAVEAERLGDYAPHISCVWQPEYSELQMYADNSMAHLDDLVNAISDKKGIAPRYGCASFADTDNGRYDEFVSMGYLSPQDYNGYIKPMSGLRMKDFVLIAGRVYAGVGLDKVGHEGKGRSIDGVFIFGEIPNYLTQYALFMNEMGILIPGENGSVYLDGLLSMEQMNYYLDILETWSSEQGNSY